MTPPATETSSRLKTASFARTPWNAPRLNLLRIICWVIVLGLGATEAWAARATMFPDGVSYLDIGDAYWRGDWHNAINAYWSPLYPWITGLFLRVFKPSPDWEFPLVHLINFFIYIVALTCFEFFLRTFLDFRAYHWRTNTKSYFGHFRVTLG